MVVTDKANLTATTTATFSTNDVAPTSTVTGAPQGPVNVGTPLSFGVTTSSLGTSDTISGYQWSVTKNGDAYTPVGNPSTTGSTFGFTPDGEGSYVVSVVSTDNYSQTGPAGTATVTVRPVAPTVTVSGTSGGINEGGAISLSTTTTDPSTGDTYSYAWTVTQNGSAYSLPNSVATNLSTLNFTAPLPGTYVATVTVTDVDSLQTIATSSSIIAADVPPTVTISGEPDGSIPENTTPVTLTATPSEPGSGQTYSYLWTVTKGNSPYTLPGGTVTNASTFTFTPGRTGNYVATCQVTDGNSGTGSASSTTIAVSAVNPTVAIAGEPGGVVGEGTAISLSATASDPGVGDSFTYLWSISKDNAPYTPATGTVLNTSTLNFTAGLAGSYVATCTVTDADQAVGSGSSQSIVVTTVNPTVTITGTPTTAVNEGAAVNLTANASSPRTSDAFSYAWSVSLNGSAITLPDNVPTTNSTFSFTPTLEGNYLATVVVTDLDNAVSTVHSNPISVVNVPPTLSALAGVPSSAVNVGTAFSISVTPTEPGPGGYTYAWTLKDGSGATVATSTSPTFTGVTALPGTSGIYTVQVTVTDSEGGHTSESGTFGVNDVAPTVAITGAPNTDSEGTAITLGSTASDVGTQYGETLSDAWSVTLGQNTFPVTNATGSSFTFTPNQPGTYTAQLVVTTSDGTPTTQTASIVVTAVNPTVTITGTPSGSVNEGSAVSLMACASSPRVNDAYSYAWAVTLNGNPFTLPQSVNTTSAAFTFTPNQPGPYVATCTVTDTDGAVGSSSASITAVSVNPTVIVTGAPTTAIGEGTAINLTATPGSPRVSDTFSYAWTATLNGNPFTLPFGTTLDAPALSFTPTVAGSYVFTVVTTDTDSASTTTHTNAITVANVPPTVSIVGLPDASIATGAQYALSASASEPGAGNYTYLWTVTKGGNTVLTGTNSTLSGLAGLSGAYHIALAVTDGEGGVGTASGNIVVTDVAPTVSITSAPTTSPEGTAISLAGNAADVGTQFNETLSYAWTITRNGSAYAVANPNGPSLTFTPSVYGNYVATLTVTDSQGQSSSTSTPITVTDVAPTATLAAVPTTLRGTAVTFSGSFADPGTSDTHSIVWNFGDGSSQTFAGTDPNALTPTHTYTTPGNYTASVSVTDSGALTGTATQTVTVVGAMLESDPFASGKTALVVNGTSGSDAIKLYAEPGNRVKVTDNGAILGTLAPTGHIIVNASAGNDSVSLASGITIPAVLYAGSGTDSLYGGGGNNILVAGTGNDTLTAGPGSDILLGGTGKDVLNAASGNDLLIGGSTLFSSNPVALGAIENQWTRTDESFATIVHQLHDTQGGSLSAPYYVGSSTITDSSDGEYLYAGGGRDWLVVGNGDVVKNYSAARDVENASAAKPHAPAKAHAPTSKKK